MRRTARPALVSARLPMSSFGSGGVPGAGSHLTAPVTRYVPLSVTTLLALNVIQEPPPVASSSLPSSTLNVPDPVTVIFELSLALADAIPPAEAVPVEKSTLMMSQRTVDSSEALVTPAPTDRATNAKAIPRTQLVLTFSTRKTCLEGFIGSAPCPESNCVPPAY